MFVKALNKYCENKAEIIQGFADICDTAFDTTKLEKEQIMKLSIILDTFFSNNY